MSKPTPISGFPEWTPAQRMIEQFVLDRIRATFELYGFAPLETRSVEPLDQLWAAMTRVTLAGQEMSPEDRLTVEQGLRAQTIDAAWSIRQEARRGSIEVGKLADFAVLSEDILSIPTTRIRDLEVDQTWVDGRLVYERTG